MNDTYNLRAVACTVRHKAHWVHPTSISPCKWCGVLGKDLSYHSEPIVFTWPHGGIMLESLDGVGLAIERRWESFHE